MKNTKLMLVGVLLGVGLSMVVNSIHEVKNEQVLTGRNATIYYTDKGDGMFDIAVEPKNGMRVTTEAPMTVGDYYEGAYITGITKEKANQIGISYK